MPGTRKLGRTSDHRKAMLRAMVTFLFETGKIETTATRAKEVRAMAEKMVTLGKREDLHAKRQVYGFITKESVAKKVIDEIGPKYADRDGGYTRIIKTGVRRGDAAEMAIIEVVYVLFKTSPVQEIGTGDVFIDYGNHRLCRWRCPVKSFSFKHRAKRAANRKLSIIESFR